MSHDAPSVLEYKSPDPQLPNPLIATLLCLPALICWVLFFGVITGLNQLPQQLYGLVIVLWFVGIGTAIGSFLAYRGRQKPWYVVLALVVNWAGIIFTITPLGWLSVAALLRLL